MFYEECDEKNRELEIEMEWVLYVIYNISYL